MGRFYWGGGWTDPAVSQQQNTHTCQSQQKQFTLTNINGRTAEDGVFRQENNSGFITGTGEEFTPLRWLLL
jgi:hypothetical protein